MQSAGCASTLASGSTASGKIVCGFLAEIKFAEFLPETGGFALAGYTPLPPVYWDHCLSAKIRINLWSTITCGQNLDVKELAGRNLGGAGPKRDDAVSVRRHGLDHHYAI